MGLSNYEVSNIGRIKSLPKKIYAGKKLTSVRTTKEYILKCKYDSDGYVIFGARNDNGKIIYPKVHRIVAMCFIPNCNFNSYRLIDHINGKRDDNRVENLRWADHSLNNRNRKKDKYIERGRKIKQLTLDGKLIKIWDYQCQIENELGYNHSNIVSCCNNKQHYNTAYGSRWEWVA